MQQFNHLILRYFEVGIMQWVLSHWVQTNSKGRHAFSIYNNCHWLHILYMYTYTQYVHV